MNPPTLCWGICKYLLKKLEEDEEGEVESILGHEHHLRTNINDWGAFLWTSLNPFLANERKKQFRVFSLAFLIRSTIDANCHLPNILSSPLLVTEHCLMNFPKSFRSKTTFEKALIENDILYPIESLTIWKVGQVIEGTYANLQKIPVSVSYPELSEHDVCLLLIHAPDQPVVQISQNKKPHF